MERSDKYTWAVCKCCGRTSSYNPEKAIYHCIGCDTQDIAVIQTPYSYKLMTHELEAMGVSPRLITDDVEYESLEDDIYESEDEGVQVGGGSLQTTSFIKTAFLQKGGSEEEREGESEEEQEGGSEEEQEGGSEEKEQEGGSEEKQESGSEEEQEGGSEEEQGVHKDGDILTGGDSDNLVEEEYRIVEI
jgi:hypothetical protein